MGRVRDLGFQPGSGRSEARGEFLARSEGGRPSEIMYRTVDIVG